MTSNCRHSWQALFVASDTVVYICALQDLLIPLLEPAAVGWPFPTWPNSSRLSLHLSPFLSLSHHHHHRRLLFLPSTSTAAAVFALLSLIPSLASLNAFSLITNFRSKKNNRPPLGSAPSVIETGPLTGPLSAIEHHHWALGQILIKIPEEGRKSNPYFSGAGRPVAWVNKVLGGSSAKPSDWECASKPAVLCITPTAHQRGRYPQLSLQRISPSDIDRKPPPWRPPRPPLHQQLLAVEADLASRAPCAARLLQLLLPTSTPPTARIPASTTSFLLLCPARRPGLR